MHDVFFTFRSVTAAMDAVRLLQRVGIRAGLLRTPESIRSRGCGYSLKLNARHMADAKRHLQEHGVPFERIFRKGEGVRWQEAAP